MKNYKSHKSETLPIFENKILEFLSRAYWFIPLIVYVPTAVIFIGLSVAVYEISVGATTGLFVAGAIMWTLAEYVLHRFIFHYHPTSRIGKRIIWLSHGVHHDYPSDPLRLVFPPAASIPLAALFYFAFYFMFGRANTPALMSGFLAGYLAYDVCHYAIHHFPMKRPFWAKMKAYHMRHHFNDPHHGFGVSSSLWDKIFKTEFDKEKLAHTKTEENTENPVYENTPA